MRSTLTSEAARDRVWDVVVVGGGPAGSAAAQAAQEKSAAVLLVDREAFPRHKLCGGGLLGVTQQHLPADAVIDVRDRVDTVTFSYRGRWTRTRHAQGPLIAMIDRESFDDALLQHATSQGVHVLERTQVRHLSQRDGTGDLVELGTPGGVLRARAVVGADGSAGRTSRMVGVRFGQVDVGLEVEVELDQAARRRWAHRLQLDWGPLPGSYGWAFPKGDHLTVGVIVDRKRSGDGAKGYLAQLIDQLGLTGVPQRRSGGHLTRCRADGSPLADGRVLVAGDAAGLLEPWTREGISYALRSGRLAGLQAASIAAGTDPATARAAYVVAVEATLGAEMRAGRLCLAAYERRPALFHAVLAGTAPGWLAFRRLTSGRTDLDRIVRRPTIAATLQLVAGRRHPGPDDPGSPSTNPQ